MRERELVTPGSAKEQLLGALPPEKLGKLSPASYYRKKI
jgi:hypothetical protein